ncbi:MAG: hypothetical protein CMC70_04105 [Flavobacteriaceae bacterium]|nr:hypothetical protein [Flavobacteriaceae bacterium]
MKKIFLFVLTLTLMNCSEDDSNVNEDPEQEVSLNISKLTQTNNGGTFIRYYNEDGTVIRDLRMNEGENENEKPYSVYTYDTQQNLQSIKFFSANDEFIRDHRVYEYSNNQLTKIIDYGDGTHDPYHTNFSYGDNRVDFEEIETGKSGYLKFNNQGKIIETNHQSGPDFFTKNFIEYDNDQVVEISKSDGTLYSFQTDNTQNPLFQFFIDKPIQYMLTEHYTYDLDFTFGTSYSVNNVLEISESVNNTHLGTETTIFEYNNQNLPVNSVTTRVNGSIIERTFEYHIAE